MKSINWELVEECTDKYLNDNMFEKNVIETEEEWDRVRKLVIVRLYIKDHPPRRLELLNLLVNFEKGKNYIEEGSNVIILEDYKTSKMYGEYDLQVQEETKLLLNLLIEYGRRTNMKYLLQEHDSINKTELMQMIFKEVTGKDGISCNILRKLYIDKQDRDGKLRWESEKKETATKMGHSKQMQQEIYKKRNIGENLIDNIEPIIESNEPIEMITRKKKQNPTIEQDSMIRKFIQEIIDTGEQGVRPYRWSLLKSNELFSNVPEKTLSAWGFRIKNEMKKINNIE
jgi:hypothetical protein